MKTKLLIEQHFHGAFGIDFNKASVDDILYLSKKILKYGIGGIFPTIVTDSIENTKRAIKNIKEASQKQTSDMAKILGIHLEGIFINPEKKGIHNPKYFLVPTIENYKLVEDDFIKIVTLAPELTEVRKAVGQEGRLFNNSNISEIQQKQQSDNDLFASLEFAPRLQSFADVPLAQSAQSVRYPDFVRPQIRYSPIRLFTFKKCAFTLAEVMIVVTIIGVVAMLVLPHFMQDMSERINSHKQANLVQKITKSVELMAANGDYQGIYDTEQFVNKLSKYLKISKVCDSEHIADCWPTKKIKTAKGQEYEVSNARTSADLYVRGGSDVQNVGLVLADGSNLILTFNPDAPEVSSEKSFTASTKSLPVGGGKFAEFAYSSNATNAIDFVMDVNGKTGPNRETDVKGNFYDIRSFKIARFTSDACPGTRVEASSTYCLVELGMDYDAYNCSTRPKGATYCAGSQGTLMSLRNHYWAGANYACKELGMGLPSSSQIQYLNGLNLKGWNFTKYMNSNTHPLYGSYGIGTGGSGTNPDIKSPVLCIKEL